MARQFELVPDLEVSTAEDWSVHGQEDRFEAGLLRSLDQLAAVFPVLEQVQLQHSRVVAARPRHILERAGRERTEAHDHAILPTRPRRGELTIRMGQALHRGRGDANGDAVPVPEHGNGRVDLRDVA